MFVLFKEFFIKKIALKQIILNIFYLLPTISTQFYKLLLQESTYSIQHLRSKHSATPNLFHKSSSCVQLQTFFSFLVSSLISFKKKRKKISAPLRKKKNCNYSFLQLKLQMNMTPPPSALRQSES